MILTAFDNPPIPIRSCDWSAWVDGQEERATGRGATRQEAVSDLLTQIMEMDR